MFYIGVPPSFSLILLLPRFSSMFYIGVPPGFLLIYLLAKFSVTLAL